MINCSFQNLPFSKLFTTYTSDFSEVGTFYDYNPFEFQSIRQKAQKVQFTGDRGKIAELLRDFNKPFDLHENARENLDRLQEEDALALVTGQQLGVYGGPLYTMLKAVSAIHLARELEERLGQPVIPVFWLADEDHDYDEVRTLDLLNGGELQHFELPFRVQPLPPIAKLPLPDELDRLRDQVREGMYETDFSDDLWQLLDSCYQPGTTFVRSFGQLISRLFSKHGLLLAGSNHPVIKAQTREVLKGSIREAEAVRSALGRQTGQIKEPFHQQVTLYDSNLFYFSDEEIA
ncbi:MAG TPA: bacillithiol biosynthesis BshC [Fodinibius sp.]|nr:bacillithiol biosynthesis BshC [Fodinibius sp.]